MKLRPHEMWFGFHPVHMAPSSVFMFLRLLLISVTHHKVVPFRSYFNLFLFVSSLHFFPGDTDWLCLNLHGYLGPVARRWEPDSCEIHQLWIVGVPLLCPPALPQAVTLRKEGSSLCRTKVKCVHLKDSTLGLPVFWHTFCFILHSYLNGFRTKKGFLELEWHKKICIYTIFIGRDSTYPKYFFFCLFFKQALGGFIKSCTWLTFYQPVLARPVPLHPWQPVYKFSYFPRALPVPC